VFRCLGCVEEKQREVEKRVYTLNKEVKTKEVRKNSIKFDTDEKLGNRKMYKRNHGNELGKKST